MEAAVNISIAKSSCANNDITSSGRICEACAKIPWDTLFAPEQSFSPTEQAFHESKFGQKAHCRACRFFTDVFKHSFGDSEAGRGFKLCRWAAVGLNLGFPATVIGCTRTYGSQTPSVVLAIRPTSQAIPELLEKALSGYEFPNYSSLITNPLLRPDQLLYPAGVNVALLESWLHTCIERHDHTCQPRPVDGLNDLKVIHCEQRIVTTAPPGCRYVALSYVWGKSGKMNESASASTLPRILPNTVEDAINMTLALEYDYLWVDRYCIDQSNAHAKQEQIMQMADVYAAAQLTIFAVAGNDSDHGLPGVRPQSRGFSSYCAPVGSVQLIRFPDTNPRHNLKSLSKSSWASRAWTFQECYFSKRRLFFTDRQVMFVCSAGSCYEADGPHCGGLTREAGHAILPGWFANTAKLEAAKIMIASMRSLEQYSIRALSFDADALNAIVGALNSYARDGVRHVWGVPWKRSSADYSSDLKYHFSISCDDKREIDIALLWYHNEPSVRRNGFPSWSPLGWKAPIRWSWERSYQSRYISAEATAIRIQSNQGFHKLYAQANLEDSTTAEHSQYLEVEARTATCKLRVLWVGGSRRVGIAMPLGNGWDAVAEVFWDLAPDKRNETVLKCILLPGAEFGKSVVNSLFAHVLILGQHEHYYERIGITRLPTNFGEPDCHSDAFFGLQNKFGRIYARDQPLPPDVDKSIPSAVWVQYWWWDYFKPDTIVLG